MARNKNFKLSPFEPEKCWVFDQHKVCYKTLEEAEMAAKSAEFEGAPKLSVYKCEFGDHFHLSSR